jgi:carboxyl-terminal processing protease
MAEFEGYKQDAEAEFEALEKKLQHNLDRDLDFFAEDIKPLISVEIMKRFYYQRGGIIEQLKDDTDLAKANDVLSDATKYKSILTPQS